jgi:DNA-binding transcriptional LysR family regulator
MNENSDSNLKVSQLRALVAVADYGNFSAAALHLELSQSTISHAIATLEEELGVVLLVRGRHGASLTHTGEQVIQEARQILQLLKVIQKKADLAKGLQTGEVRVASVRSISTHVLPEVIARFRDKFPTINVVIAEYDRYAEVEQALRESHADVGFTSLPTTAEFDVWELFRDEFVVLLPPKTLDQDASVSWEKLADYPMITNLRSPQHNKTVRDHLAQFGQSLKFDYEVREDSTVISMVRQGLGSTVIARLAAEPIPEGIQVRSLPVPLERVIGVAILADALLPREAFAFLDILKEA